MHEDRNYWKPNRTNVLKQKPLIFEEISGFFSFFLRKKLLHFMSTAFILRSKVGQSGVKPLKKTVKWRRGGKT
jgi:hypothetical protein